MAEKDKQKFSRFPSDFLKDIFITLHHFEAPEREEHLEFINYEVKHDLFRNAYDSISTIEYNNLMEDEEWFKLKSIEPCSSQDDDTQIEQIYRNSKDIPIDNNDMLRCEKWKINVSDKREVVYKIRFFHSKNDGFFSIIYPHSVKTWFQHFYYNLRRQ